MGALNVASLDGALEYRNARRSAISRKRGTGLNGRLIRRGMKKAIGAIALLALGASAADKTPDWEALGKTWWKDVGYLASDKLKGRNVGSPGYDEAAQFVAEKFEKARLKPAGSDGFFQPVQFVETTLISTTLALVRGHRIIQIPVPEEAHVGFSTQSVEALEAPVVFAGYGLVIPEAGYNDLESLPLKGAVVAYLSGGPGRLTVTCVRITPPFRSVGKHSRRRAPAGVIAIANPKTMEIPWVRQSLSSRNGSHGAWRPEAQRTGRPAVQRLLGS